MPRRLGCLALLLATATTSAEPARALSPPPPPLAGPYRVQPGGVVLACGGILGDCRTFVLEGSMTFDASFDELSVTATDLRLRDGDDAWPFPGPDDTPLVGLNGPIIYEGESARVELATEGEHGQRVALELIAVGTLHNLVGNIRLALDGTYDEGCCDRFVYDFGHVRLEPDLHDDGLLLGAADDPRFVVHVSWAPQHGSDAAAVPVKLGANHGYFYFYQPENPEIFVKMVSACDTPWRRVWFFASGLTNLGVKIDVYDRLAFESKTYISPIGQPFAPIQDTGGFPCPP